MEPELDHAIGELGVGCIVFSPLAQGMLTDKYLDGVPGARARAGRARFAEPPDRGGVGEDPGTEPVPRRAANRLRSWRSRGGSATRA